MQQPFLLRHLSLGGTRFSGGIYSFILGMLPAEHFIHSQTLHSPRLTAGDVLRKLRAPFLQVGVLTEKWFHELFHT